MSRSTTRTTFWLLLLTALGAGAVSYFANPFDMRHEAVAKFQRRSDVHHSPADPSIILDTYARIRQVMPYHIKSRPAIEQVVRDLDLTKGIPHNGDGSMTAEGYQEYNEMMRTIGDSIAVTLEIGSPSIDLIKVTVRHADADMAARIANKLIENYMNRVRSEMDEELLETKRFLQGEADRYRRKVRDLETERLRIVVMAAGVDLNNPDPSRFPLTLPAAERAHAAAVRRLSGLRALSRDKPIGDQVILKLFRLEAEVERTEEAMKSARENKEKHEAMTRDYAKLRTGYLQTLRDLEEARSQLAFWSERLGDVQQALTLAVSDRGMRLSFVQRAPMKAEETKTAAK